MSDLDQLFYWRGIAANYFNYRDDHVDVPLENRLTLLRTMGVNVDNEQDVADAAYQLDVAPWQKLFPALQTVTLDPAKLGSSFHVNLSPLQVTQKLTWTLLDEHHHIIETNTCVPETQEEIGDYLYGKLRYSRRKIAINTHTAGYYFLRVILDGDESQALESTLAITPSTVYQPEWAKVPDKLWGFIVQLYTLRSNNNWGIGDFSDLYCLIEHAANARADLIGLNPLHALLPNVADHNSPYSPSDRRFISPLYIDLALEPEFAILTQQLGAAAIHTRTMRVQSLQKSSLVDYHAVKELKYSTLESMFTYFYCELEDTANERGVAFKAFVKEAGSPLLQFALFETANNHWRDTEFTSQIDDRILQSPIDCKLVQTCIQQHHKVIMFHCFLQWLAHEQLARCQTKTQSLGMKVGLVRDLAVGADAGGAEVSSNPEQFCLGATVGAPPDQLAEQGQNWGLPPMDPAFLRDTGFSHFIQILKENMSHCGALRIDHAMSLMRLWWCPPGATADYGAYVHYPFEDMLALLCLESHLNQCAIIGEDLGVVPTEFRLAITAAKIFTNRVFYFEKQQDNFFKKPESYDTHALAMINNHDVPTLKSWWDATDLALRDGLGIFEEGMNYQSMLAIRQEEKQHVLSFLNEQDLLPNNWSAAALNNSADQPLIAATMAAVSRVASKLYVVQLEDLLLMDAPVNVPGTYKEHANWQRKLTMSIDNLFASNNILTTLNRIADERYK